MTVYLFDCANPACASYHEMTERRYPHSPRCGSCGQKLRMVRVKRKMDEATKAVLRERARQRKEPV